MNFKLNNILSFSLILIPPFLISGPLISELLMLISISIFLYLVIKNKNFIYFKNKYTYFFILFFIFINLRSLFVSDLILSMKSTFFYFRFYLLSLSIWYVLDTNYKFGKKYLNIFIISLIILIIDAFIQYKFGVNIFGMTKTHPDRISSFFGDELVLGSYLVRLLPLTIGLYIFIHFKKFHFKNTIVLFSIILLMYSGIAISGDRTAFYLSLLFLPFLFTLKNIKYLKNKIYPFAFLFIIFFSLFIFNNEHIKNRIFNSTFSSMVSFNSEQNDKIKFVLFSHNHETHIKTAYNIFLDNKFFGIGVKQYRNFCKDKKYYVNKWSCVTHPHNIYAQFLAELGIFGFAFLFIFFNYIVFRIFSKFLIVKKTPLVLLNFLVLSGLFINLFPFAPSGNFFNNWMSMIYYYPLGFYLYSRKEN